MNRGQPGDRFRGAHKRRVPTSNAVRLRDVARLAGVSTASVSRALNRPDSVSPELRIQVQRAAQELDYRPNAVARMLRTRRSMSIGAVVPTIASSIFSPGLEAIAARLERAGYELLLATSEYDPARELRRVTTLVERGVDAIIVVGRYHLPELRDLLTARRVPYVCQGAYDADGPHPCVGFDNRRAMVPVIEHLVGLGHRRFAVLAGIAEGNDRVQDRIAGITSTLADHGLSLVPHGLVEMRYDIREARAATARLLGLPERPTAIVGINDVLALGALFECRAQGVAVPEQISITGFDDLDFASYVEPPLTTVKVPVDAMGRGAADYLLNRLAGLAVAERTELPVHLVVRGSTAPPQPEMPHAAPDRTQERDPDVLRA